jgi:hypothetical protein
MDTVYYLLLSLEAGLAKNSNVLAWADMIMGVMMRIKLGESGMLLYLLWQPSGPLRLGGD